MGIKNLIIGNTLATIAAGVFFISLGKKDKKSLIKLQIIECSISICAMFVLGGIAGCINLFSALVRNILVYNNKFNKGLAIAMSVIMLMAQIIYNPYLIINYLPILAGIVYTLALSMTENIIALKKTLLINVLLWLTYSVYIISVPNMILNIIMIPKLIYEINNEKTL